MPVLKVLGHYRSNFGPYEVGQELSLSDEDAAFLLRDSPGSFVLVGSANAPAEVGPTSARSEFDDADEEGGDFDPTGAMSTQTASGLVVPDRRARGGLRRRAE